MSLTGKPPQDLSLTNLAVKDTLVATQTTAVNVNAESINGLLTVSTLQPIRSVFTGAEIGQWSIDREIGTISINGIINDSAGTTLPGTVLGQLENYPGGPVITFPGFIYCPAAPTIAEAGFLTIFTVDEVGQFSADAPDVPGDRGAGDVRLRRRDWAQRLGQ